MLDRNVKAQLVAMRAAIDAALAPVGVKFECTLNARNVVYDEPTMSWVFKLHGQSLGGTPAEAVAFERNRGWLGIHPDWQVGDQVRFGTKTYDLKGINKTATKILAGHVDGKTYLIPVSDFNARGQRVVDGKVVVLAPRVPRSGILVETPLAQIMAAHDEINDAFGGK